jgi:hypothetical protein
VRCCVYVFDLRLFAQLDEWTRQGSLPASCAEDGCVRCTTTVHTVSVERAKSISRMPDEGLKRSLLLRLPQLPLLPLLPPPPLASAARNPIQVSRLSSHLIACA